MVIYSHKIYMTTIESNDKYYQYLLEEDDGYDSSRWYFDSIEELEDFLAHRIFDFSAADADRLNQENIGKYLEKNYTVSRVEELSLKSESLIRKIDAARSAKIEKITRDREQAAANKNEKERALYEELKKKFEANEK